MVKIVNGHIVSEGEAPKSPFVHLRTDRPRRSSIADLQIAEQQREKLEKLAQEAQSTQAVSDRGSVFGFTYNKQAVVTEQPPPTLKEVINEKFSVFGVMLAVKHLVLLALGSIVIYGVQGLLICLLLVYLGTHINKIQVRISLCACSWRSWLLD